MGFLATYCLEQYSSEVYHWDPNGNRGIFHMLLTEVEQVLNGCALTANSDDPHDLQAITYPSHFAMHRNTTAYTPPPQVPLEGQISSIKEGGSRGNFWRICFGRGGWDSIFHHFKLERKGAELYLI